MSKPTMHKPIAIEILFTLTAGDELSSERALGGTFTAMIDRGLVTYDSEERAWTVTEAGRAYLAEAKGAAEQARKRRNARARAGNAAMRSLGMRRTANGWE